MWLKSWLEQERKKPKRWLTWQSSLKAKCNRKSRRKPTVFIVFNNGILSATKKCRDHGFHRSASKLALSWFVWQRANWIFSYALRNKKLRHIHVLFNKIFSTNLHQVYDFWRVNTVKGDKTLSIVQLYNISTTNSLNSTSWLWISHAISPVWFKW